MLIAALVLIGACSKPRIDTSSDEKMGASVAKVRASLPPEKQKEFDEAYMAVVMQGLSLQNTMAGTATAASMTAAAKERLNGKTADEVIAEAAKIKAEADAKAKEEAKAEIAKLEKAKAEVDVFLIELRVGEQPFPVRPFESPSSTPNQSETRSSQSSTCSAGTLD